MSFAHDELPPRARALLDAARGCDDPTPADRARASAALAPKLAALGIAPALLAPAPLAAAPAVAGSAAGSAAVTGAAATASATGLGLSAKLAIVLMGASVAAGGTMYAVRESQPARAPMMQPVPAPAASPAPAVAPRSTNHVPAVQPLPSPATTPALEAGIAAPRATFTPAINTRASHPKHARFAASHRAARAPAVTTTEPMAPVAAPTPAEPIDASLREELAIIERANTALRLEHPADALRALDEHAHRFQNGVLSEERRGLRVLALCQLSPNQSALDARDAFLRTSPNALLAPKVRAACETDAKGTR